MIPGLHQTLQYLDPLPFLQAVLLVYRENEAATGQHGADTWAQNDRMRYQLWVRTARHWCRLTNEARCRFPYSVDAVVVVYTRYRKRHKDRLGEWERDLFGGEG